MNKIKVIDLLNMISKGEEVPKKIKYNQEIFEFIYFGGNLNYYNENYRCLGEDFAIDKILNDEVEIIEEDKPIEELEDYNYSIKGNRDKINELVKEINKLKKTINKITGTDKVIEEIKKEIDKLKENK